jgi:hypothetical protein
MVRAHRPSRLHSIALTLTRSCLHDAKLRPSFEIETINTDPVCYRIGDSALYDLSTASLQCRQADHILQVASYITHLVSSRIYYAIL